MMLFAKTRSSRLFIVVLHLACVCTHLRPKGVSENTSFVFWREAVATVQIHTVHSATSMASIIEGFNPNEAIEDTKNLGPYWLQDAIDQKCLGPMGHFSECGDANLWRMVPKSKRHARRRQWIRWALEADDDDQQDVQGYFALQIFEYDISEIHSTESVKLPEQSTQGASTPDKNADFMNRECLTRRRKDNKLVVASCSEDRAWYWRINEHGILYFDKPARGFGGSGRRASSGDKKWLRNERQNLEACVWRNDTPLASLSPCDGNQPLFRVQNRTADSNDEERLAHVQFVHYGYHRDVYIHHSRPTGSVKVLKTKVHTGEEKYTQKQQEKSTETARTTLSSTGNSILPSRVDIAHSHASVHSDHAKSQLSIFQTKSFLSHRSSETISGQIPQFLGNTNPILIATSPKLTATTATKSATSKESKSTSSTGNLGKKSTMEINKHPPPQMIHNNDNYESPLSQKPIVRKIQTNPYIAASNDERWADPKTGLIFRTDLCQYLGHERKDVGRHTLTGVGQYTKTMLNIKVYGVGFYVSKRDILADPSFESYASMSSEGLRQSEDFFGILRSMKGFTTTNKPSGSFDRTILIKINMQLSTATMRSSLDADWKMLTPESKQLLIGSSMKPRPADPIFLEIAKSPDNPNRCTCAQIAPEEYNADPSCCARGTELVFTWRKNGNLEVRLNGVFMDSFPRPDIAEGIFFEYLRLDDPMSFDFLDRVVDGFPSLLAPLSQVKGVATPTAMHQTNIPNNIGPVANPLMKMIGGFGGVISSQASSFAEFVQSGTHELAGSAMDKARSVGDTARSIGEEVERRRDLIGKHVSAFTNQALSSLVPPNQKSISIQYPGWISDNELDNFSDEIFQQDSMTTSNREYSYTRTIKRIMGFEDESMSASNVTQKLFFGMVHLYLLLLLIASFPAQWTTRTKIVVTRKGEPESLNEEISTDSENSDSDESGASSGVSSVEMLGTASMIDGKENQFKKSLSYVL